MKINRVIHLIRRSKGISLKELSEFTKLSYSTLSKIETGERSLKWDTLEKIADGLRVRVSDIVLTYERMEES